MFSEHRIVREEYAVGNSTGRTDLFIETNGRLSALVEFKRSIDMLEHRDQVIRYSISIIQERPSIRAFVVILTDGFRYRPMIVSFNQNHRPMFLYHEQDIELCSFKEGNGGYLLKPNNSGLQSLWHLLKLYSPGEHEITISDQVCVPTSILGIGASSTVFSAVLKDGKTYAIKCGDREESLTEYGHYKVIKGLGIIPKIHSIKIGPPNGLVVLVSDLCHPVVNNHRAPKEDVKKLTNSHFDQLLRKLMLLHSKNIVHCDLRLENVVISPDNQAYFIDLGFAKEADSRNRFSGSLLTASRSVLEALSCNDDHPLYSIDDDLESFIKMYFWSVFAHLAPKIQPPGIDFQARQMLKFWQNAPIMPFFQKLPSYQARVIWFKTVILSDTITSDDFPAILRQNEAALLPLYANLFAGPANAVLSDASLESVSSGPRLQLNQDQDMDPGHKEELRGVIKKGNTPRERKCSKCGKTGHNARNCSSKNEESGTPTKSRKRKATYKD